MAVQTQIQARRGTAATWTSTNPTLAAGETGFETDTGKFKIGDGSTAWAALAYNTNGATASPLTTKGDLFTYSTTNARLAVGNNGESLVADSSTSTGLRYQSAYNGNAVINGGMDIWQRGTSAAGSYPTYLADRWMNYRAVAGSTYSRQNTSDTTNLPTIQYCQRISRDSGNTATNLLYISQSLENDQSRMFVGQTVTLSWYARAGANFSAASSNMGYDLAYGTGTNQNLIAGFTGQTNVATGTKTLTTTWQRFSVTGTVSASATQLGINFYFTPVGTAGAADYMEVTGVQLELGSVATTFKRAGGTIQGELAACQRYYIRKTGVGAYQTPMIGHTGSTTVVETVDFLPVEMRVVPTAVDYGGSWNFIGMSANTSGTLSTMGINTFRSIKQVISLDITVSATTAYVSGKLRANNDAAAYIGYSAEL